jgi:hypothetical protein
MTTRPPGKTPLVAVGTAALLGGGTSLPWFLFVQPTALGIAAFLFLSLAVFLWWRAAPRVAPRVAGHAGLALAAIAAGTLATGGSRLATPAVLDGLFSASQGWFYWSPVLWLGILGLLLLAGRHPARGGALAIAFGLFVLTVASRPEAARPPGRAALLAGLPLLAPGLAALLAGLARTARTRPGWIVAAAAALAVLSNLLFMQHYRDGTVPRDDTVSFPQVAESSARLVSETVGSPVAWPANWLFATRHGVEVGHYEGVAGVDLLAPGRESVIDLGRLEQDAALLRDGWGVRRYCGTEVCRDVEGRARVHFPVDVPRAFDLTVRAFGEGELTVMLNGVAVIRSALPSSLGTHSARVPRARVRKTLNELELTVSPGGRCVVDRLVFTPLEE